ncbi:uncharacterized protein LOC118508834 [Anopheles stephensi]|uniref:uncharacterized protein LOC118508834 n=1 Tax=Anopheles stephensi TaxID=30069 RepID=UPI0016589057|nr:uncharacterized protein LOC118508834 [Anopheles stephensi]
MGTIVPEEWWKDGPPGRCAEDLFVHGGLLGRRAIFPKRVVVLGDPTINPSDNDYGACSSVRDPPAGSNAMVMLGWEKPRTHLKPTTTTSLMAFEQFCIATCTTLDRRRAS